MISNYSITEKKYNLDVFPFNKPVYAKNIKKLLSSRKRFVISVDIKSSCRVVNAIRRTIMDDFLIKTLNFDNDSFSTNEDYIIRNNVKDIIRLIPIHQNIPKDVTFQLDVFNGSKNSSYRTIYTSDLIASDGKVYMCPKFKITQLCPGSFIKINKLFIVSGYGKTHACFSLASDIYFDNLDYKDVDIVNFKGNRISTRVSVAELEKLIKKFTKNKATDIYDKKVLIIPYLECNDALEKNQIKIKTNYDIIIKNDEPYKQSELIAKASSLHSDSQNMRLKIQLKGNIAPEKVLPMACDNIIKRLENIKLHVSSKKQQIYKTHKVVKPNNTVVSVDVYKIIGETFTISELLTYYVLKLYPNIIFVKAKISHPNETYFNLEIVHPNSQEVLLKTIKYIIKIFNDILNSINNLK